MRALSLCAATFLTIALPLAASAQEAAPAAAASELKPGATLWSSDGKRIGRVDRIVATQAGAPGWANVIVDSRFVSVPVTTISAGDKGFATSLSRAEIRKLK